jgi:hypothetical protein
MPTRDNNPHNQDEGLEAPPQLVSALKRLPQEPVFIPPTADEAILRAARKHLAQPEATGPECARPRAQLAPTRLARWEALRLHWLRTLLRPGTGALRRHGQDAPAWFRFMPWVAAAAAAILLLAAIPQFFKQPAPGPARGSAFVRGDLNHDGRVDILDAFALARRLKEGETRNPQLDVNGDGVVDERDVAALAARAVKLEQGGHS